MSSVYSKHGKGVSTASGPEGESGVNVTDKLTLVDHFTGFLLSVFVESGVVDVGPLFVNLHHCSIER